MNAEAALGIGMMVGTSLDGIDAALVRLDRSGDRDHAVCEAFTTAAFDRCDPLRLRALAADAPTTASELSALRFDLARDHARAVRELLDATEVSLDDVDFVAVHGITLSHRPERAHGWQVFCGEALAALLGVCVVDDFRAADLARGGQGAPLAPLADFALRRSDDEDRVILNLGGIANFTAIAAGARDLDEVRAGDFGPANLPLDALARLATNGERVYDADGALALAGRADPDVVRRGLEQSWVGAAFPRSFGREQFGDAWVREICEAMPNARWEDRLATVVEIEAQAVAITLRAVVEPLRRSPGPLRILLTGGGRHNRALVAALERAVSGNAHGSARGTVVEPIEAIGVDGDAKEAIDFAWLGWNAVRGVPLRTRTITGADADAVLGAVHRA